MELSLERLDLHQVQTTCRKTTRLLPKGKKRQQLVVVGDQTGSLLCFGMKKDVVEQVFKTSTLDMEVTRVELGGEDTPEGRDKIFMASSAVVRGYTKKGKEFLRFSTNLTEPIRSMWVGEDDIHTGGEFMYNCFVNCKVSERPRPTRTPRLHMSLPASPSRHVPGVQAPTSRCPARVDGARCRPGCALLHRRRPHQ